MTDRVALPIDPVLPRIVEAAARGHVVVEAPPGAGKTTRVPPALLDAGVTGQIVVLEPRRVAARAAASRMAHERGEPVGGTVGFQVRHERRAGADTRILVVTEGLLLRRLVANPFLEGVGVVILDEVHERSLDGDLCLAMARQAASVRDDLRIVAMSATLDAGPLAAFLEADVVRSEGRTYPVDVRHLPRPDDRRVEDQVADGVRRALRETDGDVLAFLPGAGEIRRTAERLTDVDAEVLPLHGRLSAAAQDAALTEGTGRRVVLATNVAETSVTIPGVRAVVDSGLVRTVQHDAGSGLDRLVVVPTSRASADQRAGRAGRTAPGVAYRLWTEGSHQARAAHDRAEVARADAVGAVLALRAAGEPDPAAFPWFEAPPTHALEAADSLLRALGALDGDALTEVGAAMARVPAHPRVARALVEAHALGLVDAAATGAALLSDRLPFRRQGPARATDDDLADLIDALRRDGAHGWVATSRGAVARVRQTAEQLGRAVVRALGAPAPPSGEALARAFLVGWPDRVARRQGDRHVLASGRGATLHPDSGVRADWLLALDVLDTDRTEARIHLAAAIDPAWLEVPDVVEVTWDAATDRVQTARRARWGSLVLREQLGVPATDAAVSSALVAALGDAPSRALPDDRDLRRFLARWRFLARARPDLEVPAPDDALLREVLAELAPGARSLADLRKRDWRGALWARLPWEVAGKLDSLVPDTLPVPSGRHVRLDYPDDGPPVLAVRMQELFGCTDTPRVAGTPVLLHLLAPNGRPQQVTDDLDGFWSRQWPEVRRDLRGRYPRHPWPEDPRTADPWRPGQKRTDR